MPSSNGESSQRPAPLELEDILHIHTTDGNSLEFEVVGILEDPEENRAYAVLVHEAEGEYEQFVVTDSAGNLLDNEQLAQEILNDFLASAHEEDDDGRSRESG
ncbi:MAG TPA: hypothetical protein VGI19_08900 [Candidatus Cybelea sp.]|jgi:hypothetical protein